MAIDLGSSNTSRYHTVPDHADFTLPDADWAWVALVYPQSSGDTKYIVSTGDWGGANSFNLYLYSNSLNGGVGAKVASFTESYISGPGNEMPMDAWCWLYATRRSGNLYAGQISLGGSSAKETIPASISGSQNSSIGPHFGYRAAGLVRPWKGRWGQVAFVSGAALTAAQAVELANGVPLLGMPFARNIKFLLYGKSASNTTMADFVGGHIATRKATSFGTNEEDAQTPYIWVPEYVRGVVASSGTPLELIAGGTTQANTGSESRVAQTHALAVENGTQSNATSSGAVMPGATHELIGAASTQANFAGTGVTAQTHALVTLACAQFNSSTTIAIAQTHVLTGDAVTQGNLGGMGSISTVSNLEAASPIQGSAARSDAITLTQTLTIINVMQANGASAGTISNGTMVESTLIGRLPAVTRIKKPGIPAGTPEWLKTMMEILTGRRGNRITVPKFQALTFSAVPTKAECEALYSYTNEVRTAVENIITRLDS